ncbi:MAG TPA: pyruvate, phosphate dikinase [Candidatus Omnitrophica bacterium]|nr:MAG: pyruvate, phosphate dikinase [Omnitrophica WOR_2 bacterium GWA2_63_20]OGX18006.1 MAG: pyruvate, phosphate dikinase [Omnitrophica WOR_2 bacterium GWF2_63_9]OGX32334.1 MAG: pyruvate, phosphate dikinase [Omnitrophica WOR_2 bacterium RIFCSPHIGHO2_12_FULL_64_13]OGX35239.1 MAG: pyruvate, phosphate dikinase [Omnitrophica WOR_2 bacterium RIFCSPHIGHO2_02_FULL_63_39]OGX48967.1 MAG: pyruvate, phosphate dikinase [Omnitrophica WOR_2 bacterium RIFCSPLOWO2_12_FULL_63_16]HBH96343.1 pyruvate, phosphate
MARNSTATRTRSSGKTSRSAGGAAGTSRRTKDVYHFGGGKADGSAQMRSLLGGKGANLAEMTRIGLPVPPGFTITTEVCTYYDAHQKSYPKALASQVEAALRRLEALTGKRFGDRAGPIPQNPLLVSVRSGARDSMPGMMDTILNLGLNDVTVAVLARRTGNPRFAWDSYRRFIQMYGDVVMGVQAETRDAHEPFEEVMTALKREARVERDADLTAGNLEELVHRYKQLIKRRAGREFPQDPHDQLWGAIGAVFGSWNNDRAIVYRRKYNIPHEWGTAVNVQAMVFGNLGSTSGTGVAFTRDPATGEKVFYGEYLINAQGEDVVAGIRTPQPIAHLAKDMPKAHAELERVRRTLERHFTDMQDFEFTIEDGTVYMLQTRSGKRTGLAAVRIAVEMVQEKVIDWKAALLRVPADSLAHVLAPVFDRKDLEAAEREGRLLCRGLAAGPGAASGSAVFSAEEAASRANKGERVLLVRIETTPEDLRGMIAAEGILTARGGVSSHAALVARQMGKVCVCGAQDLHIDYASRLLRVKSRTIREGDSLSIDGTSGEVFLGEVKTAPSEVVQVLVQKTLSPRQSRIYQQFAQLMQWADKVRRLGVRMNADQPDQAASGVAFGAEGIGLCRTEHMFFGGNRIDAVREMILAETPEARRRALAKLLPYQREDFVGIFRELKGLPVTIRTLDPPLHEFLPNDGEILRELAEKLGRPAEKIAARVAQLHEANPMLGHRGCRLGISYPEITEMQARAIFEAAAQVQKEGVAVRPEIMIPLVGFPKELQLQLAIVRRVANEVQAATKQKIAYLVGTMIEIPRAALVAEAIAADAQFFSFGTNDLTQTVLGMSRDDSGSFLPAYVEHEIVTRNPFASIDQSGVGKLMEWAIAGGRKGRADLKIGICGEHGGDPSSIEFCHRAGLNYVSCSPYRVPVARLAAAHAALKTK